VVWFLTPSPDEPQPARQIVRSSQLIETNAPQEDAPALEDMRDGWWPFCRSVGLDECLPREAWYENQRLDPR